MTDLTIDASRPAIPHPAQLTAALMKRVWADFRALKGGDLTGAIADFAIGQPRAAGNPEINLERNSSGQRGFAIVTWFINMYRDFARDYAAKVAKDKDRGMASGGRSSGARAPKAVAKAGPSKAAQMAIIPEPKPR